MFENFKKIQIEGGYFEQSTGFDLFDSNQCLSIIYGRNGSGKTSIAKAMRQLVGKDSEPKEDDGSVQYTVSSDQAIPDDKKTSVFIFDEEFVRENVRTKGKGLETIVMMGEQVDLDTQITIKKTEISVIDNKMAEQIALKEKYEKASDTSSPQYFFNRIRDGLREDGGWADIDRDIKGNTVKSRVTEDFVIRLASLEEPKETEDVLRQQLRHDFELFAKTEDALVIDWKATELKLPRNLNEAKALLKKRVERPVLSEREIKLMSFLQEHIVYHSFDTTRQLTEEKWPFCPLCLRETSNEDYEHISDTLKRILNRESEAYSKELDSMISSFDDVEFSMPEFPNDLNEKEKNAARLAGEQLNNAVAIVRDRINQRKKDLYGVLDMTFSTDEQNDYVTKLAQYLDAIKLLENCVSTFNRSVNEREDLKKKVLQENETLAKKRLTVLLNGYKNASKAYEDCKNAITGLVKDKERVENEIKALKAQIERTDIALDYINEQLQYVFYSDKKAKLVAGDGCYKLKIHGRDVPPKKISVGERNVLGLCYFFAKLFSNKRKEEKYKDEILLIIDDPISSFDYGNKLGVMSLLRYQFSNIKKGNSNSRILVLTHDLRSAFDLVKVRSELNGGSQRNKCFLELVDRQLKRRKVSSEYKKLLEYVYEYAKNPTDDEDEHVETGIGNAMRRVIEAFSSFCYNMSFEEMMCREGVLSAISDEKRKYYENFMCRLTLNGESHMEERVYSLNTITPYFTKQEKVQTAKSLLLFLSYINKEHLSCYLGKDDNSGEDRMAVIESWENEELNWMEC
jgi:energy-coupling factor transporter ATP-binding protein EcfA2